MGHGNPLQYTCLENPRVQRRLVGCNPRGRKESDTTDWLSTAHSIVLGSYYWNSVSDMLWEFVRTYEMVTSVAQKTYNVLLGCPLKEAFWLWSSEEKLNHLIERQKHLPYCKDKKHTELWLVIHLKWKLISNWVIYTNPSSFFLISLSYFL